MDKEATDLQAFLRYVGHEFYFAPGTTECWPFDSARVQRKGPVNDRTSGETVYQNFLDVILSHASLYQLPVQHA